jgi:DNA repair exonuclease SbcCD nuclease subunit
MKNTRRDFIVRFSAAVTLIGAGTFQKLWARELLKLQPMVKLRFIVASDAHYGQPDTPFEAMASEFVTKANIFHHKQPCDFCVINGDIIHDEPKFMSKAKRKFSELKMPLYATQGNHDRITAREWQRIWKISVNHSFVIKDYKIILVTTSNEDGDYLAPDLKWLSKELRNAQGKEVFLFVHIPQKKWTKHAIDTEAFFDLLDDHKNVKAIFHGHEHEEDGIYLDNGKPFIFDSHIGGSWGTDYKGFRVVEVLENNDIVTYMMNPDVEISRNEI